MNASDLGKIIKEQRKKLKLTQKDLSMVSGVGTRFVSELENGKETCELGKALRIVQTLGLRMIINDQFDKRISS